MCGFLIAYSKNNFKTNQNIKKKFRLNLSFLNDRGPDETSVLEFKNFLIGFNRLNINNIKNGSQPFVSKSKRYIICFNGEIVNYKKLIKFLLKKKIKLYKESEAEVILALYLLYKNKCLNYLKGMFSFVIIDKLNETIFSATDRFGIKPLYYGHIDNNKCFYLTSNFSALVETGLIKKKPNYQAIKSFLSFGQLYDSSTLISNVKDLKNGNFLEYSKKGIFIKKYWLPKFKKNEEINTKILLEKTINKLQDSIKDWKTSEEKLSLCLSDGVDSQILLSLLTENDKNLETFTIGLKPNQVLSPSNKNNNFIDFNLIEALKLFRQFSKKNYILLSNSSDLTLFQLYNSIRNKGYKVTFTGDGADEIFGGYPKYQKILSLSQDSKNLDFVKNYFNIYKNTNYQLNLIEKKDTSDYKIEFDKKITKKIKNLSLKNKCLFLDQLFWIPTVQKRHDFIGMNFGLEVRPFFLDHDLVNLINSLPTEMKFDLTKRKVMAHKVLSKISNFKARKKKYPTPSFVHQIIKNKRELHIFLEDYRYGILNEYFEFENIKKLIKSNINKLENIKVIFWRLFLIKELLK
tara:strand:- start:79 stop:1800 length:1722 start_codon:yes stop_codon:yes gene_type:complete